MFTFENHVGRLLELRLTSGVTDTELRDFHEVVSRLVRPHSGLVVVCTDLLSTRIFPPSVAERWTAIIRQESPRIERNAVFVGEGAIFSMQVERIIREAGMTNRRA